MTKKAYYLASAAVIAASVASIVTYTVQKATKKTTFPGLLVLGTAGLVAGAALAAKPGKDAVKRLAEEPLLDEEDTDLMQINISEILGNSAERGEAPKKLREIEVDEDATVEDFIKA